MSVSIIPESAPFSAEQRAWLNGFLAGWAGLEGAPNGVSPSDAIGAFEAGGDATAEEAEEFPWHDSNLAIDERLALADGKPLKRRLMAAMAQLDCGACGYLCQTYSEAIAAGDESNLKLCSPGGKETAKTLKRLLTEEPVQAPQVNGSAKAAPTADGFSRSNPYLATISSCVNLNGDGSAKCTTHAVINLHDSGVTYNVGDSLGVYPTNCPDLVNELLEQLGFDGESTREALLTRHDLREVSDALLERLQSKAIDASEREAVAALVDSDELDTMDVLDAVRRAPSANLAVEEFLDCLSDLQPRLYSIASSLAAHPGEVHLTIGRAVTQIGDREHKGVASTMFADRASTGDSVRVFVQPSHGFGLPADPSTPIIMVGPGTGIAPFRAFLAERRATAASGRNWLFFGDQHASCDFLYREEFAEMQSAGLLTRLDTAFSRDQAKKIYVQDRMREEGASLFQWLEEGAHFYVCGDAKRMANDVDRALHEVVADFGNLSEPDAKAYVANLRETGRYARDVY